jgi:hypothetical protein
MYDCHQVATPMKPGTTISLDDSGDDETANILDYQRIIGKLLYLSCGTRSDISFVVGVLSQ